MNYNIQICFQFFSLIISFHNSTIDCIVFLHTFLGIVVSESFELSHSEILTCNSFPGLHLFIIRLSPPILIHLPRFLGYSYRCESVIYWVGGRIWVHRSVEWPKKSVGVGGWVTVKGHKYITLADCKGEKKEKPVSRAVGFAMVR